MSNDQIKHDLWYLSGKLRATRELLSHMYYCFSGHINDYTNTEAAEMNSQITRLLANIESLIEAAQAVQYVSSSTTREVLKTAVALKGAMHQYKHDLERGIEGSEDDIIRMNRPSVIYPRAFKSIMKRAKQFCSDLRNLESEVKAVSLMNTEEEKSAEKEQNTTPAKMKYDVFICHASEDKKEFVKPLADALIKEKLRVWYDEFELTLGDSLREKIDYGLANSEYGVVVLSEAFFRKKWPQDELDGLVARQNSEGKKVILPIWHKVSYDEVKRFSPTLAGKFATKSEKGIKQVVDDILKVINYSGHTISTSDLVNKSVNQQYDQIVHKQAKEESVSEKPADIDHIIELMEQIAEKLRKWADQNKKLIRKFSASLTGPLPPMDYERVVAYLQRNNPNMARIVQGHYEELISCAKEIDTLTADGSHSALEIATSLVGKLRFLANRLAQTLEVTAQNLTLEKPAGTGQAYTGKEECNKFTEKLSEIANLETPLYPFKAGKIQYWNLTSKPGHLKYGSYRFSKDDCDVIENTVGFPLTISKLRAFLVKNCSVQDPIDYSWPDIIAVLSLYRNDLASQKPAGTEQTTPPAKALSKELEKPEVGTQAYPGPRRQVPTSDADRQRAFLGGYTVGEYKYAPDLPRGETATKQDTAPSKRQRIWTYVKRIPHWIYYLVVFLAAMLTCLYLLWWLWTNFLA